MSRMSSILILMQGIDYHINHGKPFIIFHYLCNKVCHSINTIIWKGICCKLPHKADRAISQKSVPTDLVETY